MLKQLMILLLIIMVKVDKASEVSVNNVQASVTATVNALPTATFQSTASTICIDPLDKQSTNIQVNFTGAPNFNLTYKVNNGSAITKTNLSSPYSIKEQLSDDATIMLLSVTDANGCVGSITGQSHQVSTQKHASLDVLTAPAAVCEGSALALEAPTVINNDGAIVSNSVWFLNNAAFNPQTLVTGYVV